MTVEQWRASARARLADAGDIDAETDSSLFLCSVLGTERGKLGFLHDRNLSGAEEKTLEGMLLRRIAGEPEQYIEGAAYFMGLRFRADKRALIPRFDTEILCEAAFEDIGKRSAPRVLDLCTGSGCLAVAIARYYPKAEVWAADISIEALALTRENAALNAVKIETVQSDGLRALEGQLFDVLVCNPPYLTRADMDALQTEVRHEPRLALYGGEDGLSFYRRFAGEMKRHLCEGATALFEVGQGQAEKVAALFREAFPNGRVDTINDLNGIERVVRMRL